MSGEIVEGTGEENETPVEETEEIEQTEESGDETSSEEPEEAEEPEVEEEVEEPAETANYKEAFKKHPELRKAFFEYNQFTQIFPTPKDAQEAYEEVQTFQDYQQAVQEGNVNPVIQSIIDANPQAFTSFAEGFLGNLKAMDASLYERALAPEVSKLLKSAMAAGQKNNNKSLFLAAQHISHWLFDKEVPPDFQVAPAPQKDNQGVQQRSQEFFKELDDEISGFLNVEASRALDPNNVIPAALKRATISDIISDAIGVLKSDSNAQNTLKILRDKAARSGFTYESRKVLRDAYMTKIKPIIARLKGTKREEAMKSLGKTSPVVNGKKVLPSGSSSGTGRKPIDPKKVDASRTSMRDALDGNFVLKGQK